MVKHKQPPTLYALCQEWFCEHLAARVANSGRGGADGRAGTVGIVGGAPLSCNQTLSAVRTKLRPFFVEHLPAVVRASVLEETSELLLQKSLGAAGVDCDYGRSILYLISLLLSKEVKRLKVTLCCYYGCRDMDGVLRTIKKNGNSLEHLELSRSSLLRMDPLLFRNVLTSATRLTSLVVRNICSDAMLKLIGTHCHLLEYLDIANSKQVSDAGIDWMSCQMQIRDKRDHVFLGGGHVEIPFRNVDHLQSSSTNLNAVTTSAAGHAVLAVEDFDLDGFDEAGFASGLGGIGDGLAGGWRRLRRWLGSCVRSATGRRRSGRRHRSSGGAPAGYCGHDHGRNAGSRGRSGGVGGGPFSSPDYDRECLVEIKQVPHPICFTLKVLDLTDTSVTNSGLLLILKRLTQLTSLGEYNISDNFLRSLTATKIFRLESGISLGLLSVHARKVTAAGMKNLVHTMPRVRSLTCWEPQFELQDLCHLHRLRHVTLLRISYSQAMMEHILNFVESSRVATKYLEKLRLEFILEEEYLNSFRRVHLQHQEHSPIFDIARIFNACDNLKVFTVEFKDSLLMSPCVGYGGNGPAAGGAGHEVPAILLQPIPESDLHSLSSLVHVQLGQIVRNSAVAVVMINCSKLKQFHCNSCPDLRDEDLRLFSTRAACLSALECFYIYEAPHLTFDAFRHLVDSFPVLARLGNLTRWAVDCEGIQSVVRAVRENNFDVEILCGSHWFAPRCCSVGSAVGGNLAGGIGDGAAAIAAQQAVMGL